VTAAAVGTSRANAVLAATRVSRRHVLAAAGGALVVLALAPAPGLAQAGKGPSGGRIYTCIDASGRRLTADRPIAQCLDREQQELGGSGAVRRVVPPSYTAEERERIEAERRREAREQALLAEARRRDRALLLRYPDQATHERERADALAQIDAVIEAVERRLQTLRQERRGIDEELAAYGKDAGPVPAWLRRKSEDNERELQAQRRFLQLQADERARVQARFDEELARLRRLWQAPSP
jgi:hypothetical protein